jgi:hypothetical protein
MHHSKSRERRTKCNEMQPAIYDLLLHNSTLIAGGLSEVTRKVRVIRHHSDYCGVDG